MMTVKLTAPFPLPASKHECEMLNKSRRHKSKRSIDDFKEFWRFAEIVSAIDDKRSQSVVWLGSKSKDNRTDYSQLIRGTYLKDAFPI